MRQTRNEIERLIGGEAILKNIREELTYSEPDQRMVPGGSPKRCSEAGRIL